MFRCPSKPGSRFRSRLSGGRLFHVTRAAYENEFLAKSVAGLGIVSSDSEADGVG